MEPAVGESDGPLEFDLLGEGDFDEKFGHAEGLINSYLTDGGEERDGGIGLKCLIMLLDVLTLQVTLLQSHSQLLHHPRSLDFDFKQSPPQNSEFDVD